MESCDYRQENEEGEIGSSIRCGKTQDTKEVQFKHPDYKEKSVTIFVCVAHFDLVFGEMFEKEDKAWRNKQNAFSKYKREYAETKIKVGGGVGTEYFDWETYKVTHYKSVDDSIENLKIIRRKECRLEYCNEIVDYKHLFTIRVFRRNALDFVNLSFCCQKHWDSMKLRIGIEKKKPTESLDILN